MTEQEAIKIFKDRLELTDYRKQVPEYYKAMELAVKALEKQIPKKPTEEQIDFEEFVCICPTCKYTCEYGFEDFRDRKYEYCPMCGQKLDWGEEE